MANRCKNSWSDLPHDLLTTIRGCLHTKTDVSRFRAVCKSWRSSVPCFEQWPLFPFLIRNLRKNKKPIYFRLTEERVVYHVAPPPNASSSSTPTRGWLVKVQEGKSGRTQMLHPLNSSNIKNKPYPFPKVFNLLDFQVFELAKTYGLCLYDHCKSIKHTVGRVAVNLEPHGPPPALMFIVRGKLYHCKLGLGQNIVTCKALTDDKISSWSWIYNCCQDVVFHNGMFYAVCLGGETAVVDPSSLKVTMIEPPALAPCPLNQKHYLVQSFEELLLVYKSPVEKIRRFGVNITVEIKVFKLNNNAADEKQHWVKMESLGDRILILGDDGCFSVSAQDFPGCEGNCVYFYDPCFAEYCRVYSTTKMFNEIGVLKFDGSSLLPLSYYRDCTNIFWPTLT